jgi:hypothetical protein
MKKATATSHGKRRLAAAEGSVEDGGAINGPDGFIGGELGMASLLPIMLAEMLEPTALRQRLHFRNVAVRPSSPAVKYRLDALSRKINLSQQP